MTDEYPAWGNTVLVIGGHPPTLEPAKKSLERAGYRVVCAPDGREGLRVIRAARPDLIIISHRMPDISGRAIFEEIIHSDDCDLRRTPVIMLAYEMSDNVELRELFREGLAAYICEPVVTSELLRVIEKVFSLRSVRRGAEPGEADARAPIVRTVKEIISLLKRNEFLREHSDVAAPFMDAPASHPQTAESKLLNAKICELLELGLKAYSCESLSDDGLLKLVDYALVTFHVGEQNGVPAAKFEKSCPRVHTSTEARHTVGRPNR